MTVEGETFPLPEPFHVLATANPIEYEGTYPLPEAQLDRFLMRVSFGYPTADEEYDVVQRRLARRREEIELDQITDAAGLRAMQAATETVTVDETVGPLLRRAWPPRPASTTRSSPAPRPAGRSAWCSRPAASPSCAGRDYVIPEDVKAVARAVLSHRITVKPGALDDPGQRAAGRRLGARVGADPERPGEPPAMTRWRTTASLARGLTVGALGVGVALLLGRPAVVVLVGAGDRDVRRRTARQAAHRAARRRAQTSYAVLHEGQGTTAPLRHPAGGRRRVRDPRLRLGAVRRAAPGGGLPRLPRRPTRCPCWCHRGVGASDGSARRRSACSVRGRATAGDRSASWAARSRCCRRPRRTASAAEAPSPIGLIGAHRSRRDGDGTEFSSIREFHAGDRMRRINWRVSLRSGALHVVSTRSEEDTAVLLVVDALADYGLSGGVDGAAIAASTSPCVPPRRSPSSTCGRATGSRCAWSSPHGEYVGYGAGSGHLRRILGQLSRVRPGAPARRRASTGSTSGPRPGTMVVVLSPMLSPGMATSAVRLLRRGLPVIVVDTLPGDAAPTVSTETDPTIAALAWRMRLIERRQVLDQLAAAGCPVVPWNGTAAPSTRSCAGWPGAASSRGWGRDDPRPHSRRLGAARHRGAGAAGGACWARARRASSRRCGWWWSSSSPRWGFAGLPRAVRRRAWRCCSWSPGGPCSVRQAMPGRRRWSRRPRSCPRTSLRRSRRTGRGSCRPSACSCCAGRAGRARPVAGRAAAVARRGCRPRPPDARVVSGWPGSPSRSCWRWPWRASTRPASTRSGGGRGEPATTRSTSSWC